MRRMGLSASAELVFNKAMVPIQIITKVISYNKLRYNKKYNQ